MARDEHHVVHNPNGGWDVKRSNAQRVSHSLLQIQKLRL